MKANMEKQPWGGALLRPKRNQSSKNISPASVRLKSICRAKVVYPRMAKTTGLVLDRENAIQLATGLLALAHDTKGEGEFVITAMNVRGGPGRRQVNVVKRIKKLSP